VQLAEAVDDLVKLLVLTQRRHVRLGGKLPSFLLV
jgi:hypothetical protein